MFNIFRKVHKNIKDLVCRLCKTYKSGRKRTIESHLKKKHGESGGLEQFIKRLQAGWN